MLNIRCAAVLVLMVLSLPLLGRPVRDQHVEAELVASTTEVQPGGDVWIALRLKHDAGWHTYWESSTTGYATTIEWQLPPGVETGEILWPVPDVYVAGPLVDYVLQDTVLLPVKISVPTDAQPGSILNLKANAEWLMCEEVCIPGSAQLSLSIKVASRAGPEPTDWTEQILKARGELPISTEDRPSKDWSVSALRRGESIVLEIIPANEGVEPRGRIHFFDASQLTDAEAEQEQESLPGGGVRLTLPVSDAADDTSHIRGVISDGGTWEGTQALGLKIDVPVAEIPSPSGGAAPASATTPPPVQRGLAGTLLLALIGGLILNLMPCVFPVLGIKIMGFVNQAGHSRAKVIAHGLAYTVGIVLSFWVLVAALLAIRSTGTNVSWGYQLQHPEFVFILSLVLLLFGLNMSGVFEIGQGAVGVGSKLQSQGGLRGAFFSGVLATVVATPCSAPFLGTAVGYALAQPPATIFLIFTFVALGLSLPYLLMSAFPGLIRFLPRPGAWMETFKQALAFLLYGTVAYLVWNAANQITAQEAYGSEALLGILMGLVAAGFAAWVYGRWSQPHKPARVRLLAGVGAFALLAAAVAGGMPHEGAGTTSAVRPAFVAGETHPTFVKWKPGLAEELAGQGKLVWVDFTADWCVTCKVNKWAMFRSDELVDYFRTHEVIALKADLTSPDATISDELARWQKGAVPFNLIYAPGHEPVPMPTTLTPGIVLSEFEELSSK